MYCFSRKCALRKHPNKRSAGKLWRIDGVTRSSGTGSHRFERRYLRPWSALCKDCRGKYPYFSLYLDTLNDCHMDNSTLAKIGTIFYALVIAFFGINHFIVGTGMQKMVPTFLPGGVVWV
jgi:hypothetical protein